MKLNIQLFGSRGASSLGSNSRELNRIKYKIGDYGERLKSSTDLRYENGKLVRTTKVGDRIETDRPVRSLEGYKIYARHFQSALPYTHYYIANTNNGKVYEIPEIVTEWNSGVLKEITENLKNSNKDNRSLRLKNKNKKNQKIDHLFVGI